MKLIQGRICIGLDKSKLITLNSSGVLKILLALSNLLFYLVKILLLTLLKALSSVFFYLLSALLQQIFRVT